ncbi:ricin-agglutinin family protein [Hibiscus syriacus]|uniref:Ricin-agglutinin family protein n=2 Tax=Hibiscus syriacus TaxID=106335 RepID=A0A6A3AL94_HIBSY|nr:ricin-agglutinin family protein [Hibiscus syriacus]
MPVTLTYVQAAIFFCMGLQNQDVSYVEEQMKKLERQKILSQFKKVMIKLYKYLYGVASKEIDSALPRLKERVLGPHSISVDEYLNDAAKKVEEEMRAKADGGLNPEFLQHVIEGREAELENALENGGEKVLSGGVISVKSSRSGVEKRGKKDESNKKSGKKRGKDDRDSKSTSKKRKP